MTKKTLMQRYNEYLINQNLKEHENKKLKKRIKKLENDNLLLLDKYDNLHALYVNLLIKSHKLKR